MFRVRLAGAICGFQLVLAALALGFSIANWSTPVDFDVRLGVLFALLGLAFAIVGVLLATRRPTNPIGWCFSAIAGLLVVSNAADAYSVYALATRAGSLPYGRAAAWLSSSTGGLEFIGPLALIFLIFPTGKLPSDRWKPLVWLVAAGLVFVVGFDTLAAKQLNSSLDIGNPYRREGLSEALGMLGTLGFLFLVGALGMGIVALVLGFRRAAGVERQQLKWLAYSATIITITMALAPLLWIDSALPKVIWPLIFFSALATIPVSAGIAILRFQLFDIDVIINRTIVYGSLVALLGATYAGIVIALQSILSPLASGSDLAVAGSTLAVAAAFRPARSRIQRVVDRRFYRAKFDGARTVAAFSTRLRDEIDLDALTIELRQVVHETLQPRFVALWLRDAGFQPPGDERTR